MTRPKATAENFTQVIDSLSAYEAMQLIADVISSANKVGYKLQTRWVEKCWNYPEIWVPLLNYRYNEADPKELHDVLDLYSISE